jgi:hypothetical protein
VKKIAAEITILKQKYKEKHSTEIVPLVQKIERLSSDIRISMTEKASTQRLIKRLVKLVKQDETISYSIIR